jgi:hypothetical protein
MTMSAWKRGGGLATNGQFYTLLWGNPGEALANPKIRGCQAWSDPPAEVWQQLEGSSRGSYSG